MKKLIVSESNIMITKERITAYINSLDKDLPPKLYKLEQEALKNKVPIIRKETQGVIRFLLNLQKP